MKIRNIIPPSTVKVQLIDNQTEEDVPATGAGVEIQPLVTPSVWNSLHTGTDHLLISDPTRMVGYVRLHQMYQQYRIPSATISLTLRRAITEGGGRESTQRSGVYFFIYKPNDGVVTLPPWYTDLTGEDANDKRIQEMKADPRSVWAYLPGVYDPQGVARKDLSRTIRCHVNTVQSQQSVQPASVKADTGLNGTLPSHASGLGPPTKPLVWSWGAFLEDQLENFSAGTLTWDATVKKNCIFFHRQDDFSVL